MLEESKEMKMIRDVRDKHYEETKGMSSKQLLDFYRQRAKNIDRNSTESQKTNDKSFPRGTSPAQ
ncbi:MAG: hypothetical protein WA131_01940 [Desulfitobacteriaceae bacterium]